MDNENSDHDSNAQGSHSAEVIFENVRIFNGSSDGLSMPSHVLVVGDRIAKISDTKLSGNQLGSRGTVVAGGGRTLMPGLIDAHVHLMMESVSRAVLFTSDIGYITLAAAKAAEKQLLRGFTTVRDMGGASFALKRAIDEGIVVGPRIFPSGAFILQTGGHGDFGLPTDVPRDPCAPLSYTARVGMFVIADGYDQVLLRARENLRQGASQLKLMAGGGFSSSYDPLDVTQYTVAELHAAVEAADNWNTYVTVHAYTPSAIRKAISAGVKCIEHGHLIDESTAELLAEKGIWLCLQPFLDFDLASATDTAYKLASKYQIKTAWGTDNVFDAARAERQGAMLAVLRRWYTPGEVLKMATGDNAELLSLSGPRNTYSGKLGVVEEGALADLLLVDGDPMENMRVFEDPTSSLLIIMKGGKICKNVL